MIPAIRQEFLRKDRPWRILISGLFLYTVYDIFHHISRPGSSFEEHPWAWSLFSVCSLITMFLLMFAIVMVLNRTLQGRAVIKEVTGLFIAVSVHVNISGPLYNSIFWPYDELYFYFNPKAVLILLGIYLFLRLGVFNLFRFIVKRLKARTA